MRATSSGTAFVIAGGGNRGAVHVGQLRALFERNITPDLIVGTSVGAINGSVVARDPHPDVAEEILSFWETEEARAVFGQSWSRQLGRVIRGRTYTLSDKPLVDLISMHFPDGAKIEDLAVPFVTVATSIERAAEQSFDSGPLVPAVVASASVPGLLPPTRIGDEHYLDGGLVASVPLGQAIRRGATTIYVLQAGQLDKQLRVPTSMVETLNVYVDISRRHSFTHAMDHVPDGVTVHVLPTGGKPKVRGLKAMISLEHTAERADLAYEASVAELDRIAGQ
ncbi:patatin-like phospholipase family protein [Citricoccus sp. GCM10030269]|uniref:patatin-like phospholipase family protein n=1 Tax=Citricoccus sp. GCM10030269 TaxID=3273388 RepID=UPI0036191DE2